MATRTITIGAASIPQTALDTDATMAADSDAKLATQKATKAHTASAVTAHAGAVDPHGDRAYTDAAIAAGGSLDEGQVVLLSQTFGG